MKSGADELLGGMGNLFLRRSLACRCLHCVHLLSTEDYTSEVSPNPPFLYLVFLGISFSFCLSPPFSSPTTTLFQDKSVGAVKEKTRKIWGEDGRVNLHHSLLLSLITSYVGCCGEGREAPYHTYKVLHGLAPELSHVMQLHKWTNS